MTGLNRLGHILARPVILLLLALVVSWWLQKKPPALEVDVTRVHRGSLHLLVATNGGRVVPDRQLTVRAEAAGRLTQVRVRRGERVESGQELLRFDTEQARGRLKLADIALAMAREQHRLEQTRLTAFELQRRMLERDLAGAALRRTTVRAAFAGILLEVPVVEGQIVAPGEPLALLADVSSLHVDAAVDQSEVNRVQRGAAAVLTFDALGGQRITSRVSELAPAFILSRGEVGELPIWIALPPDPAFLPGMTVNVDIESAPPGEGFALPPTALLGHGAARSIWLVTDGNKVHRRPVVTGRESADAVEVIAGVTEGDHVVATLLDQLVDGAVVIPRSNAERPSVQP